MTPEEARSMAEVVRASAMRTAAMFDRLRDSGFVFGILDCCKPKGQYHEPWCRYRKPQR